MALDPVVTRHKQLITAISDELGNSGPEYDNFVEHMKGYVPRGILSAKKSLLAKLEALASKGHLKPGKYDVLKKISEDSGNNIIKELIEEAEEEIQTLLDKGTERNSHNNTGTRQSTASVRLPVQETANDGARPAKRTRTDLDSPDPLHRSDIEGRGYYDSTGKNGILLILNSEEDRKGTEKDVEKLKQLFGRDGLGFEVFDPRKYEDDDLTTEQLDNVLTDVRGLLNGGLGKQFYCFICVILSHGNENGIKTKNGLKSVDEIRESFNNKHIPEFAGRPKVFFIQACRGTEEHDSQEIDDADDEKRPKAANKKADVDEADEIIRIPTDADTLMAYATTPGYKSFRRLGVGSWFITECINVFQEYHKNDHLEDMLITVREKVALHWTKQDGAKQMPCVWSTLTKRLMLTENSST